MPQQQMYSAIANIPGTELSAAITTTTTTISILSGSTLPDGPNIITIGSDETSETVLYTSKSGNSLIGCTRGFGGTTAKAWAAASRVARYYTAYDHEAFRKNLTDLSGVTSEATTDIVLSAGQQILNATKNARLQGLKVQGRTLIDLLGGAGSGESLMGWSSTGTTALDSTKKVSGSSSIKFSTSSGNAYMTRDFSYTLDTSKQYIVGAWVYIESFTSISGGEAGITIRDYGTTNRRYSAIANTALLGQWQFVYVKIPIANTLVGTGFRAMVGLVGTSTSVIYIDDIRLYAVSGADYAAIGTTINNEAIDRLLPYVPPGINGVDGLWVRRCGKNLLPSVPDTLHANAKMNGPYDMTLTGTSTFSTSRFKIPVVPGKQYTFKADHNGVLEMAEYDVNDFQVGATSQTTSVSITRTIQASTSYVQCRFTNSATGTFNFKDWQLEIGSTVTTFQPREDSLIAFGGVELHANPNDGSEPDILREVNGRYEVTRLWREMVLDGALPWAYLQSTTGFKTVILPHTSFASIKANSLELYAVKFNGISLVRKTGATGADEIYSGSTSLALTIPSADSGWGDSYTPSQAEIQAYFYGWKMYDTSGSGVTTSPYNRTDGQYKGWVYRRAADGAFVGGVGSVPTTQAEINAYWQPYQLLYRLAAVTMETVQEDGSLSLLEGDNFIEVGSGYVLRERAAPLWESTGNKYHINNAGLIGNTLKYRADKILRIFRDSRQDDRWTVLDFASAFGKQLATIPAADYDPSASYSVSYIKLDKSPVPSVSGFYAATEKAQLHDLTDAVTEISSTVSALAAKKAEKDAPGWIAPTLLNGFTALFSSRVPSYRKVNGVVEFTGALKFTSSTVNANLVIFRLPEGYRPKDQLDFGVLSGSGANRVFGGLEIMPTGEVYVLSGMGGDAIFLDGLPTFRVD